MTAFVWVTLVCGNWADAITGGLVRLGYEVAAGKPGTLMQKTDFSSTLCIKVTKAIKGDSAKQVWDDVFKLLKELKASHYNVIVSTGSGGSIFWANGIIFKPETPKNAIPPGAAALLSDEEPFG